MLAYRGGAAPRRVAEEQEAPQMVEVFITLYNQLCWNHIHTPATQFIALNSQKRLNLFPLGIPFKYPHTSMRPYDALYGMIINPHNNQVITNEYSIHEITTQEIQGQIYIALKLSAIIYGFDASGRPTCFESYPQSGRILLYHPITHVARLFEPICELNPNPSQAPRVVSMREIFPPNPENQNPNEFLYYIVPEAAVAPAPAPAVLPRPPSDLNAPKPEPSYAMPAAPASRRAASTGFKGRRGASRT